MANDLNASPDLAATVAAMGGNARAASRELARAGTAVKNRALEAAAQSLLDREKTILAANAHDVKAARAEGRDDAFVERLTLTASAIEAMAEGLREVAKLPDPVGEVTGLAYRPSGIQVGRMRVPLGVIAIIYESRPNVTADAGALCLKSGNACILRGGSEALKSNQAIAACLAAGLKSAGLPADCIQLVDTPDRAVVTELVRLEKSIDAIVPRGGKGLIERVAAEARVPGRGHRAHREIRLAAHGRDRHRGLVARATVPARGRFELRHGERIHAIRRRLRVRAGRRDRHLDREAARARARRARGPHVAEVDRAGRRPSADLVWRPRVSSAELSIRSTSATCGSRPSSPRRSASSASCSCRPG